MSEIEITVEFKIFLFLDFTAQFSKMYLKGFVSVQPILFHELVLSRAINKPQ